MGAVSPDLFSVTAVHANGDITVVVRGDLDLEGASSLTKVLDDLLIGAFTQVIIDLSGLTFADSQGLSVLIRAHKRLSEDGRSLVLRNPNRQMLKLLQITGLMDYLNVEVSRQSSKPG